MYPHRLHNIIVFGIGKYVCKIVLYTCVVWLVSLHRCFGCRDWSPCAQSIMSGHCDAWFACPEQDCFPSSHAPVAKCSPKLSSLKKILKQLHVIILSHWWIKDNFIKFYFWIYINFWDWLKPPHSDRGIEHYGYTLFINDHFHKGGSGVADYVRRVFPVLFGFFLYTLARPNVLFLDININGIHVLVGVCYRAPNLGVLADFEEVLLYLMDPRIHKKSY